jgi:hypothetical protein
MHKDDNCFIIEGYNTADRCTINIKFLITEDVSCAKLDNFL